MGRVLSSLLASLGRTFSNARNDVLTEEWDRSERNGALVGLHRGIVTKRELFELVDARTHTESASLPVSFIKIEKKASGIPSYVLRCVVTRGVDVVAVAARQQQTESSIIEFERFLEDGRYLLLNAFECSETRQNHHHLHSGG